MDIVGETSEGIGVRTQRDTRRAGALMESGLRETRGELEALERQTLTVYFGLRPENSLATV